MGPIIDELGQLKVCTDFMPISNVIFSKENARENQKKRKIMTKNKHLSSLQLAGN